MRLVVALTCQELHCECQKAKGVRFLSRMRATYAPLCCCPCGGARRSPLQAQVVLFARRWVRRVGRRLGGRRGGGGGGVLLPPRSTLPVGRVGRRQARVVGPLPRRMRRARPPGTGQRARQCAGGLVRPHRALGETARPWRPGHEAPFLFHGTWEASARHSRVRHAEQVPFCF